MSKVKINLNARGYGTVEVDGAPIDACAINVIVKAGKATRVIVELPPSDVELTAENAVVETVEPIPGPSSWSR